MSQDQWKRLYERMLDLNSKSIVERSAEESFCRSDLSESSKEPGRKRDFEASQESEGDIDSSETFQNSQTEILQSIQKQLAEIHNSIVDNTESTQVILNQSETLREMSGRIRAIEDDHFNENVLKPILNDLILLFDEITRARKAVGAHEKKNSRELDIVGLLEGLEQEILNILTRHNVSLMRDTGQKLDPKKQKVVAVKHSDNLNEGTFLSEVRAGFYWNNNVLRYQEVVLHRPKTKEEEDASKGQKADLVGC